LFPSDGMKIKSLYINGYKNLIETEVNFQSNEVPIVIIGSNGTGKSNLLEAIIHIFISLYNNTLPKFSYSIKYECYGKAVDITRSVSDNTLTILVDGNSISKSRFKQWCREIGRMSPFPDLVFCYYSGTCKRTKDLLKKYNTSYNRMLRSQTMELERVFVYSDIEQAKLSLLALFAHRHSGLLTKMSLSSIQKFVITVVPPEYYSPEIHDPISRGTVGAIREFLADLDNLAEETFVPRDMNLSHGWRTYIFNKERLERVGSSLDRRRTNFMSMMQSLISNNMLREVSFELVNTQGATHSLDDLSEGEKQLLSVIGGLKLFNQPESLVLLDEPDTHLNPAWSWEYESLLKEALSDAQKEGSMVLLATHDPIVISGMTKEQVLIANIIENRLSYIHPIRDPRGQGVANVLTSEFFGLPSSLDKNTQNLLDERLTLAYKTTRLNPEERLRLDEIEEKLKILGMSISFRDPDYAQFEREKYGSSGAI